MKTHVHGDSSIYGVLVNMACKYNRFPLFNSKGNFGGLSFEQSSSRYTEAYINDVARLIYLDLLDYADYEDGEVDNQEPRYLPSLLPYCFLAEPEYACMMSLGHQAYREKSGSWLCILPCWSAYRITLPTKVQTF